MNPWTAEGDPNPGWAERRLVTRADTWYLVHYRVGTDGRLSIEVSDASGLSSTFAYPREIPDDDYSFEFTVNKGEISIYKYYEARPPALATAETSTAELAIMPGANQIRNPDFGRLSLSKGLQYWELASNSKSNAMSIDRTQSVSGPNSLKLVVGKTGGVPWDPHAKLIGLSVVKGRTYTYSVYMRADRPAKAVFDIRRLHEEVFFGNKKVEIGTEWKEYSSTVMATQTNDGDVMVLIQLGITPATIWIDRVRFYEGPYAPSELDPVVIEDGRPAVPKEIKAIGGRRSIALSWNEVPGATSYKVFFAAGEQASISDTQADDAMIRGTRAVIAGLEDGARHSFVVVAANETGDGPASAVATAMTDLAAGDAIDPAVYLPTTPGLCSEYRFFTDGPNSGENGKKWITFQEMPGDARLFYTFFSENGGMSGFGRYFNWAKGYYFVPYRAIAADTRQRGFFDLLTLPDKLAPGQEYSFRGVNYAASRVAEPNIFGKSGLVRISVDSTAGSDPQFRGTGSYVLEPKIGILRMEFRHVADGALGPAGVSFSYELTGQRKVTQKNVAGRILDPKGTAVPDSYVTIDLWKTVDAYDPKLAICDARGAFALTFYAAEDLPFKLNYGSDRDYDGFADDWSGMTFSPPFAWTGDRLDLGVVAYEPKK
ncbi:MAG: carbohydrate binding domain-containing protein, partial [Spirochaetaceae bacterium]|nr:carbohydrate binding domain-containing protein [Spirochaetaceae bacterium]